MMKLFVLFTLFGFALQAAIGEANLLRNLGSQKKSRESRRLEKAWEKDGIITHMAPISYFESILNNSNAKAPFYIQTDCGPQCHAGTYVKKGIPLFLFVSDVYTVGTLVGRRSKVVKNYAQGILPYDSNTNSRIFCSHGPPEDVALPATMETINLEYAPENYNISGCKVGDKHCQFIAGGGGFGTFALTNKGLSEMTKPLGNLGNGLGHIPFFTPEAVKEGLATQCGIPQRCSDFGIDSAEAFENAYWKQVFEFASTYPTNISGTVLNVYLGQISCKLDGQNEKDWEIAFRLYEKYLEAILTPYWQERGAWNWNEVNLYVPLNGQEREKSSLEYEESILGFIFGVPEEISEESEEQFRLAVEVTKLYNSRNKANVHLYNCTGRTNMTGFSMGETIDELIGENGCVIGY